MFQNGTRAMSVKRRRTGSVLTTRTRSVRPIDKKLIAVNKDGTGSSQVVTTIITATFPCTVTGLRWSIDTAQDAGTGEAYFQWAIVLVKDGNAAATITQSDAGEFYTPEQNVLAFGTGAIDNNSDTMHAEGNTKTMRKLMGGDLIQFIIKGVATNTVATRGVIQIFCKT